MDPTGIPLFGLIDRRMAWLDRRVGVLAGNIANADTPGYRSHDVAPFAAVLAGTLAPTRTDPHHAAGTRADIADAGEPAGFPSRPASALSQTGLRAAAERAPDGNAVSIDEELRKLAETDSAHELVGELFRKYVGMIRTAAGR